VGTLIPLAVLATAGFSLVALAGFFITKVSQGE